MPDFPSKLSVGFEVEICLPHLNKLLALPRLLRNPQGIFVTIGPSVCQALPGIKLTILLQLRDTL
jgi:hypothetical protein